MKLESTCDDIMRKFSEFTEGVRVQMLINRNIQNSNKVSKRFVNKLISFNSGQFRNNILNLLEIQMYLNDSSIRLYSSVNRRNLKKSINHYHHKFIDLHTSEEVMNFFKNTHDKFVSFLMKSENKDERLFLLDIDSKNFMIDNFTIPYKIFYSTPNGYHMITVPFDPIILNDFKYIEVKKDALLLLNCLN